MKLEVYILSWYSYKKYCLTFFHKNFYTYHVVYLFSRKIPIVLLYYTGCPNKHGNSVTNSRSSLLWISIVRPDFKSPNIIMSARVYFIKMIKDFKYVSHVSARWTVKTDKFTLFVYCNFLVLQSTTECRQNINKQIVNIADETLTDYSFLSRYHFTKSKN